MPDRLSDASTQDVKAREEESESIWDRATRVLTTGLWSVSHGAFRYPDGVFPLLARRGEGCILWDTTGRPYVDWMIGWGPVILGYRHPAVEQAIRDQLAEGPLLSLLHPLEVEVAERLCDAVPCAERVAFGKNGSDVLAAAVRVARAFTGREIVLHHGYHGFHDWYLAAHPACEGIPEALRPLIHEFGYNDLEGLARLFDRFGDRIAAVVMEPTNIVLPAPGFLESVRQRTRENGSLLVFDEIITGFRLARGGAQEAFGVVPDLACVGKALANGMPLSALVGRSEIMQTVHRIGYGMTFRGETLSLAAARACLEIFEREPVAERLAATGAELRARYHEARDRVGVDTALIGPDARQTFAFGGSRRITPLGCQTLFVQESLKRGVLTNGNLLPCLAHDEAAIEQSALAFHESLEVVARAVAAERLDGFLQVPPLPIFFEDASHEYEGSTT
jgi:glutamate-1-semialdehyde 2,1-aminomutase